MKTFIIAILLWLVPVLTQAQTMQTLPTQHTAVGALEGSHLFLGQSIYGLAVTWHTQAARWLMIFDATSVPGSMSGAPLLFCQYVQGSASQLDGTQNYDWTTHPIRVVTGVVVVLSTNPAACTSITTDGANDWISGQVQ
jgi:hypothetical protein